MTEADGDPVAVAALSQREPRGHGRPPSWPMALRPWVCVGGAEMKVGEKFEEITAENIPSLVGDINSRSRELSNPRTGQTEASRARRTLTEHWAVEPSGGRGS